MHRSHSSLFFNCSIVVFNCSLVVFNSFFKLLNFSLILWFSSLSRLIVTVSSCPLSSLVRADGELLLWLSVEEEEVVELCSLLGMFCFVAVVT